MNSECDFFSKECYYLAIFTFVEILLAVVTVAAYIYIDVLLWKKEVYNVNHRLLLAVFPLGALVTKFAYYAEELGVIFYGTLTGFLIEEVTSAGLIARGMNCLDLIVDRIVALCCPEIYEKKGFLYLIAVIIFLQYIGAALLALPCAIDVVSVLTRAYLICGLAIFFDVVFASLYFVAKRLHAFHIEKHSSVQQRYISVENYRAAWFLASLMVFYTVFYCFEIVLFVLFYNGNKATVIMLLNVAQMLHTVEILFFLALIVQGHPRMKYAVHSLLCTGNTTWLKNNLHRKVTSFDGRELTVDPYQEQNVYFKGYEEMWKVDLQKTSYC